MVQLASVPRTSFSGLAPYLESVLCVIEVFGFDTLRVLADRKSYGVAVSACQRIPLWI